jgi:uncharacterized damage-inducible protein DinB
VDSATIEGFLRYYDNIRGRTSRVIACIPREHFEWRPGDSAFSFADLIRHLGAIERYMFAENAQGLPSRYPGHGADLASGYDVILAFFGRTHDESMAIFRSLDEAQWNRTCTTPGGAPLAVWKWLRAMVEHEVHHRGQIYLMLNILRVPTPPLYGLTSEEVLQNSQPVAGASR